MTLKEAKAMVSTLNLNLDEDQAIRVAIFAKELYSEALSKGKLEGYAEAKRDLELEENF